MDRKLAAVLAADMVGYSRLMEADEQGTLARLRTHRIELIDPSISINRGKIIKTTGDGMLVEFSSARDAVACAVEVQTRMCRRNMDVPEDRRIRFRIGVNLGDIICEDGDIFGSGVNVAARLEQMAGVGEVLVSSAVYDQVCRQMELQFQDMGELFLKNLSHPVRAYRVALELPSIPSTLSRGSGAEQTKVVKPTIAILPFANMSGDPEQEFFVDGLTEDLLTELSRRHELFVISRNSSFVYKGKAVNLREVSEKLGAQYIVEGSVRKAGSRLRVTVQLIDSDRDTHIWAERYDREMDDIFAIQDEITAAVVATLPGRIEASKTDQIARKKPSNLAAYECVLAAKVLHHRSTPTDNEEAIRLIDRAISLDPEYAHAHAWSGCIRGQAWGYGWSDDPADMYAQAEVAIRKAAELDDNDADVHRLMAAIQIMRNDLGKARYHQERALSLNPNYDLVVVQMGELLTWMGQPEEGVEWIEKAMRLNPHHPARFWSHLGKAHFCARNYDQAIDAFHHLGAFDVLQNVFLAACHGWRGDEGEARRHADLVLASQPQFSAEEFLSMTHYGRDEDRDHLREGMARAGLS